MTNNHYLPPLRRHSLHTPPNHIRVIVHRRRGQGHALRRRGHAQRDGGESETAQVQDGRVVDCFGGEGAGDEEDGWFGHFGVGVGEGRIGIGSDGEL